MTNRTCLPTTRINRIVSGGQTGVDRAALDFAIGRGIDHGGWIPKGRKAEDGPLSTVYKMVETKTAGYAERTRRNVLDSDGTLIIYEGRPSGGTALTGAIARQAKKPLLMINLATTAIDETARLICKWIAQNPVEVLNIAGPRASQNPEIYDRCRELLEKAWGE